MLSPEISEFLADFRLTTHAVLFYDNETSKRDVLFNHLKCGERGNQGLAYVCSSESPQQVREDMKKFGIDADGLRLRNRLVINNYDSIYIVDGKVNVPKIGAQFKELAERYITSGLDGMRASAEMSCFFQHDKVDELMESRLPSCTEDSRCLQRGFVHTTSGNSANITSSESSCRWSGAHDPVIMTGPNQSLLLEPEKVEEKQVEETMKVRLPSA